MSVDVKKFGVDTGFQEVVFVPLIAFRPSGFVPHGESVSSAKA
jgi:hypothetical protein